MFSHTPGEIGTEETSSTSTHHQPFGTLSDVSILFDETPDEESDHSILLQTPGADRTVESPVAFHQPLVTSTPRPHKRRLSLQRQPLDVMIKDCCSKSCLKHLSFYDVEDAEQQFRHRNEAEQLQYVLTTIWTHSKGITVPGQTRMLMQHRLLINGHVVCPDAWCIIHNCTKKRIRKCETLFRRGVRVITRWQQEPKEDASRGK